MRTGTRLVTYTWCLLIPLSVRNFIKSGYVTIEFTGILRYHRILQEYLTLSIRINFHMILPSWNRTNPDKCRLGKISVGTCTTGFLGIEPLKFSKNCR